MGHYKKAVFSISSPNGDMKDLYLLEVKKMALGHGIPVTQADSLPGMFSLNQDFLEFVCEAETDWWWVKPLFLTDNEWKAFYSYISSGKLICIVHYYSENEKRFVPHH